MAEARSSTMEELLRIMIGEGATDLHITTNAPPRIRIDGKLMNIEGEKPLTQRDTKRLAYSIMTDMQKKKFEESYELDFSFGLKGLSRFRCNVFYQRSAVAIAVRQIPWKIRSFESLGLPKVVQDFAMRPKGLVLVTGPTGSGKSTTLAAVINKINEERNVHIITIEDPIEYLHSHKKALINQRELGADTRSFAAALRSILRQDPDVILVGEMRDPETIRLALQCSETGHLTFSTLHTNSCDQSIHRIIDVFPPHEQPQIRAQLAFVLEGVVSQALIPKASGQGRQLCLEIMVPNSAIRNLIREDKIHQIYGTMQTGQDRYGMLTFNQSLVDLIQRKTITKEDALGYSQKPDELLQMLGISPDDREYAGTARRLQTITETTENY